MGCKIWDRNGNLMPNGNNLMGNGPLVPPDMEPEGSNANGVVIVRNPANKNQYYVFSGDPYEVTDSPKIYYSMVDMTLNNGYGDVVDTIENKVLMVNNSENMAVTFGGDCKSFWIIVQEKLTSNFYAYKIDENGVAATPVITPFPASAYYAGSYTQMTFAPDGITMAFTGLRLHLAKFNNITGEVYDFVPFDGIYYSGNVAFSPDASKLYIAADAYGLMQVDLSLMPDASAVSNSLNTIDSADRIFEIRTGPDDKIYTIKIENGLSYIGRIESPNLFGTTCNFNPVVYNPPSWSPNQFFVSLGEPYVAGHLTDTVINTKDTISCSNNNMVLLSSDTSGTSFVWNTGDTGSSINIIESGTYWVQSEYQCTATIDSFLVTLHDVSVDIGNDTSLCAGDSIKLNAYNPGIENYQWSTGDTSSSITVTESGIYTVQVSAGACEAVDTIDVAVKDYFLSINEIDTTICSGAPFTLHVSSNMPLLNWDNGATMDSIVINQSGVYTVSGSSECGSRSDSVKIEMVACDCSNTLLPNAFSPNGDGINDEFRPKIICGSFAAYNFSIFNRYGQLVFHSSNPQQGWDGFMHDKAADIGIYFYYLTYKGLDGKGYVFKGDLSLLR